MFQKMIVVASAVAALSMFDVRSSHAAVLASQGFEAAPAANNWAYTLTGTGGVISNNKGPTDSPETNIRVVEGDQSFQRIIPTTGSNTASTLSFVPIATSAGGGNSVSIRLGSHGVGTTSGNGMDAGDYVRVYITLDVPLATAAADVTYLATPDIAIEGNVNAGNARWTYNSGTGVATANITQDAADRTFITRQPGDVAATPQNNRTSDGYSTLVLNLPDTASTFAMKIVVFNNSATELFVMDNIQAVPEPTMLGLVALGGTIALKRRRRA